ncbi:MAG: hypothetical protein D6730_00105, partial [Bacteroidetes bacterium]
MVSHLLLRAQNQSDVGMHSKTTLQKGDSCIQIWQFDCALSHYLAEEAISRKEGDWVNMCTAILRQAKAYYYKKDFSRMQELILDAQAAYHTHIPSSCLIGSGLHEAYAMYFIGVEEVDSAINHLMKGLHIKTTENCLQPEVDIDFFYNNLGLQHELKGDYEQAISWYLQGLNLIEQKMGASGLGQFYWHNKLGVSYKNKGLLDLASHQFKLAYQQLNQLPAELQFLHNIYYSSISNNLADVYLEEHKLDSAFYLLNELLGVQTAYSKNASLTYHNLARAHFIAGQSATANSRAEHLRQARVYAFKALAINTDSTNFKRIRASSNYRLLGRIALETHQFEQA